MGQLEHIRQPIDDVVLGIGMHLNMIEYDQEFFNGDPIGPHIVSVECDQIETNTSGNSRNRHPSTTTLVSSLQVNPVS